jgi:hypothetical protein
VLSLDSEEPVSATLQETLGLWDVVALTGLMLISFPFIFLEHVARERFLGRMRFEIDRRYRNGISDTVRDFEHRWRAAIEKMSDNLAGQCDQNLKTLEDQLARLLDDRDHHAGRDEERRGELDEMESSLDQAVLALLRGGSDRHTS